MTDNIEVFINNSIRIRDRIGTISLARQAAELINEIQPEVAIPVHYGSVVGGKADEETFIANVKDPVKVEIKLDL